MFSSSGLILVALLGVVTLVQLFYLLYFFRRLAFYKAPEREMTR
jgi:hypothetical protein